MGLRFDAGRVSFSAVSRSRFGSSMRAPACALATAGVPRIGVGSLAGFGTAAAARCAAAD
eukprot:6212573-Pleurochrysis_carterae.AAC.5